MLGNQLYLTLGFCDAIDGQVASMPLETQTLLNSQPKKSSGETEIPVLPLGIGYDGSIPVPTDQASIKLALHKTFKEVTL